MNKDIDLNQHTLFGEKIISTINFDEQEIIRDILYLHSNGKYIDCDPCYSIGNFYKKGLPRPKHVFDKTPKIHGVVEGTSDNIPLPNESVNTIMFDPPFLIGGENYEQDKEGSSVIAKRFTSFKDWDSLKEMYSNSLKEF